jgi:hypothetical protein
MNTRTSRERRKQRIASSEADQRVARSPQAPDSDERIAAFPDPWLFDTPALLDALAVCRETIWRIPMANHAVHLATQAAADQIWRLEEHIRFLLHLQREGQREFAKKAPVAAPTATPTAAQTSRRRARA